MCVQSLGGWWSFSGDTDVHVTGKDVNASRPVWFADLIARMATGGGEDRLRGEVLSQTDCHGVLRFRVSRRGRLVRCEDLSGAVIYIAGHDTAWYVDGRGELVEETRRGDWFSIPDDFEFGARRLGRDRWNGDDFTRPTGPAREVSFLGRAAWEVELAPPPRKPHPVQLTVDQQTGLILREGNAAFGTFTEWVTLDLDVELPDELFVWHAETDVVAPLPEPLEREPDPHWREILQEKLPLLDAVIMSIDRFDEMHQLVAGMRDGVRARRALMDEFGLDEHQARAILSRVLGRHAHRPSADERRRFVEHRDEVRRRLREDD